MVRWLTDTEMFAWRSYVVATLRLRHRLHRELVEGHGLSLIDYEVLVCISMYPDRRVRMTDLAVLLGSTKSRLSHQIGRMELAGMIRRTQDSDDRRGVVAELTEGGKSVLRETAPLHVEGVRNHFADLITEEEQKVIGEVFSRVLEHLKELEA